MIESALKAENLCMHFGGFRANQDVSFSINPGEILGLVGPNGAGKSTLLNVISGFLKQTSGRKYIYGKDISWFAPENISSMGFLRTFQHPKFIGELTTLQNAMLAGRDQMGESWFKSQVRKLWSESETELEKRCEAVIEKLDLSEVANIKTRDLSFGQLKLLNFGMAMVSKASVIALDEPVAGMAVGLRTRVTQFMKENASEQSYLVISHDLDFIRLIADRLLLMNEGKIILEGSVEDVLNNPKTLEVFLGYRGI